MSKTGHFVGFQPLFRPFTERDEKSPSHSPTPQEDSGDMSTTALTEQINNTSSTRPVDIERYITRLEQDNEALKVTNKELQDEVNNHLRCSKDLRERYDECNHLNVLLKEDINKQVKNVRSWRVKALTNECDAAIYRQENDELRETIVMIQREMLQQHPCYCMPSTPDKFAQEAKGKTSLDPLNQCPESVSTQKLIKRFLENFCSENRASLDMQVSTSELEDSGYAETCETEQESGVIQEISTIHCPIKPDEKESGDSKNARNDRSISIKREDGNESNFESKLPPMEPTPSKIIPPEVTRGMKIRRFDQQTPGCELENRIVPEDGRQSLKSSLNDPPKILRPLMPRRPGMKRLVSNIRAPTQDKSSDKLPSLLDQNNQILPQIRSRPVSVETSTTPVLKGLKTSLVQYPKINSPSIYNKVDVSATIKSSEKPHRNFSPVPPSSQKPAHRRSLLNDRQQLPRI